ncbi:TetR family transcriptional regulator [Mycolicibacterium insubricum]|jgi:AcrR family transcriptional regulator|uniref:TetR family transcriptional regulator n=2 Tax=Mycolicibacterium insubricum TaxID=444597 RepID=A0A1X0D3V5_9MYCO|nr:TetR/AcrR family transcriptional regulator [Mycolicibacterium insubricum]MCB9439556.1 TetR/AcrR family transcriptional regulator [Mycolicibacterium sp.]ORA67071.1 TetR family transcriptional regulator [Mycolicibacterium insubricum]BBZ65275.1 TetR family transcriptional regulator [Mycolicibacterium insubricum]
MTATAHAADGAVDTRARLIDVAVDLFTRHSFAGTSLQMIADELGFTKAAIYHHFRTREQLLDAVVAPILAELRTVVETAEGLRGSNARADHMLAGFAELAVHNRAVAVLAADPAVALMLRANRDWSALIERQLALLTDLDPGPTGRVRASMVLAGIAGASGPAFDDMDRTELSRQLVDAGRRTLGLRTSRRRTDSEKH